MKRHLSNAGYGVLDYVSYPAGMLLVAPIALHRLGAAEYGLWMISTAIISAGGIIASGFCDASIQRVALLRGKGELKSIHVSLGSMLSINIAFGLLLGAATWIAAPYASARIAVSQQLASAECVTAVRLASVAVLIRAIESVAVGAQRAFEQYRSTVRISASMRLFTLASAAILALFGYRTCYILAATDIFLILGTRLQFREMAKLPGVHSGGLRPGLWECRILLATGVFAWLQSVGGVVFNQFDRIFLGLSLGAALVAPYSLCVQFAHPVFGLTAAGLNFLFPYLSERAGASSLRDLRRVVLKALACNVLFVAVISGMLLLCGDALLRTWAGAAVAQQASSIFLPVVLGAALLGLSVTGTYALQALGSFKLAAYFSLGGRGPMFLLMIELLRQHGLQGLAWSRLCYGLIALVIYFPLFQRLSFSASARDRAPSMAIGQEAQEG